MADVKLVIAVSSCAKHRERQVACAETWFGHAQRLDGVVPLFFTGESPAVRSGAVLHLDCADDWNALPGKVGRMFNWVQTHYPAAWLFKCDDDTLVMPNRLLEYLSGAPDYSGQSCYEAGTSYALGGAGYLLSPRAVGQLAPLALSWTTGHEDLLVGRALAACGIPLVHSDRFAHQTGLPPTAQSGRIAEQCVSPELMRQRWLQFHCNEGRAMTPTTNISSVLALAEDYSNESGSFGTALPVIYGLAVGCRARQILEIGVNRGGSTRALLAAAAHNGGQVTSIDIADCAQAIPAGERQRWRFLQGDSKAVLEQLAQQGARFDFAFIDGDHSYEAVRNELALLDAMLTPGATVLLDDCWEVFQGVLDAFNLFRPARPMRKSLIQYGTPKSWGGVDRTFGLVRYE